MKILDVVIYTDFDMVLWGMGIILLFITALQYLSLARKKDFQKYYNAEYRCMICKKPVKGYPDSCPHCGEKIGISKEDMKKTH